MVENDTNNAETKSNEKTGPKSPLGDKIIIDTMGARSGSCVFNNFLYALVVLIGALYVSYIYDKATFQQYSSKYSYLGYLEKSFTLIEDFSPFHQFLQTDEEVMESLKRQHGSAEEVISNPRKRILTKAELAKYDGSEGSPGTYLAFLGKVYDVSKGMSYYGPGGGYAFFTAKDGSRAFVSGQFDEAGLVEDVSGLSNGDYLGLKEWEEFYEKDYTWVGILEGNFYDSKGEVTQAWKVLQGNIATALKDKDKKDVEKKIFPPCNLEWSKEKGTRFWCTKKSGGIKRNWVGVPRRLFYPGREERCACIRSDGPPSVDPGSKENRGDLDNPHLKDYEGCAPDSFECWSKTD